MIDTTLPVFAFPIDWAANVRERLEWRTDTIDAAEDGSEQTRDNRPTPRRWFEVTTLNSGAARQRLGALAWRFGSSPWYLPLVTEGVELTSPAAAAAIEVDADVAGRDFAAGGVVMLKHPDRPEQYELAEVSTIAGTLGLQEPLAGAWPAGTRVLPVRRARLDDAFSASGFSHEASVSRVRFRLEGPNPWPAGNTGVTYRGQPVLTERPVTVRDPTYDYARRAETFDDGIGPVTVVDPVAMPLHRQTHDFVAVDRGALGSLRSLIYGLHGRQKSIWVPSWQSDLTVVEALGSGAVGLRVRNIGYAQSLFGQINRRDLRIELVNGTVLYRRVTGASVLSAAVEQLTLDDPVGVAIEPGSVLQVSFLALCRSDADLFEFNWFTGDAASLTVAWRGRRHDV